MIQTLAGYKASIGFSGTSRDAAYAALLAAVDQAIRRRLRVNVERATYANVVLTPPASDRLVLRQVPIVSVGSIYLNSQANGDPSAFTADNLLTPFTDYFLDTDESGLCRSGIVFRTGGRGWGSAGLVAGGSLWPVAVGAGLTRSVRPAPGSLLVTYTAGYAAVPDDLVTAASLAVSALYRIRKKGVAANSEGWNGYSGNWAAIPPGVIGGVLASTEIAGFLSPYCDAVI